MTDGGRDPNRSAIRFFLVTKEGQAPRKDQDTGRADQRSSPDARQETDPYAMIGRYAGMAPSLPEEITIGSTHGSHFPKSGSLPAFYFSMAQEYRVFPRKTAIAQDGLQKPSKGVKSLKASEKQGFFQDSRAF
jgi:hypothetical protein